MITSFLGRKHIAIEEACALQAYQDGPHLSIGYGHNDPTLKAGDTIAFERAFELLGEDLIERDKIVTRMLKGTEIPQHEFDMLVSCYFNKGNLIVPVVHMILDGDRLNAMALFLNINRDSKGVFKRGLANRRNREMNTFLSSDYGETNSKVKLFHGDPRDKSTVVTEFEFPVVSLQ